MRLAFHPEASDEFVAAAEYYDAAVPGLGNRFLLAVSRVADVAMSHPEAGGRRGANARRLAVSGFPYDLVYQRRGEVVEVLAIAHHHRRPGYWRERRQG